MTNSIYLIPKHKRYFFFIVFVLIIITGNSQILFAQQTVHEFSKNVPAEMNYLFYVPGDYQSDANRKFPLILFLHGGSESGDSIEKVKKHGLPMLIEKGIKFPFIFLSPQNPHIKKHWDVTALVQLLNEIIATHRIEEDRVYLTGLSRGGCGAWSLAVQYPEKFAALVPICGVAPAPYASWLKDIPVWAFHGAKDEVIPVKESEEMVEAINKAVGNAKLTIYPEATHDSWTAT